jgi:hypothetical protein
VRVARARVVEARPTVSDVLSRLDGVRPTRRGWSARCPAHPDRLPSLSIAPRADGGVLLHCFAGCSYREILRARGLEPASAPAGPQQRARHQDVHTLALRLARSQRWADPLAREISALSRYVREQRRAAEALRCAATASGDTEAAWVALVRAARGEVEVFRVEAALDEMLL